MRRMLYGPYAPFFAFEVVVGLLIPFLMLVRKTWRARVAIVAAASALAVVGIYVHRLNIVLNGLSYPLIDLPPGVSTGRFDPTTSSFLTMYFYMPSPVEWLIVVGVLAFGALIFTFAVMLLPMRESAGARH
jgi:molybdopterin-containing oxidoreductase family membrane subunit